MSIQLKLLDHFKLTNHLGINFACSYSEDDRFFIINDLGVYILAFAGTVSNEISKCLSTKSFIHLSDFTPCGNVDLDINSFHNDLPQSDVYELIMKNEYSVNLKHIKPPEPTAIYAEWSPKEVYMKYLCDTGEVQYSLISNITEAIIGVEKPKWSSANRFGTMMKLEEYKKRINSVSPSTFAWSHMFKWNETNASVIFCGHLNGDISVWRLKAINFQLSTKLLPTFLGRYRTQLKRLTTMYWHQSSEHGGGLFFGDIEGKLNVVHVTNLNENCVLFDKEQFFLTDSDKIKIDKITVMTHNNFTFVIIAKQRVLIIFGINHIGEVFDTTSQYIQDYYITGLYHFDNKILVLSLPGLLTELSVTIKDNKMVIEKSLISLKSDLDKYRTHGFFFSKNMVLCGIIAYPWDLQSLSKSKTYVNVFIYHNSVIKPLELLWKNEINNIAEYWDCFEALRIICVKEKRFPWLGIPPDLNYDTLSPTQLKILRVLAKISETVFQIIPTIKTYDIKPYILIHYLLEIKLVIERMTRLLKQRQQKGLTTFQMRSLFIQNFFLKEMVAKDVLPKANVGKTFIEGIRSVMEIANELEYPEPLTCAWCGDKIFGPACFPPHVDSRCCFSMMPIFIVPEYKCPYCKCVAHKAIEEEMFPIVCPYCDQIMDILCISDNQLKENCDNFEKKLPTLAYSDCYKDCLKESIEYEEIEDNSTEYVIFSDSDEDPENLISLYEQFSKTQLDEVKVEVKDELDEDL